jgi:hypothetical protein
MNKEKEKQFYDNLGFDFNEALTKEVMKYINRHNLEELNLSRFDLTLKHKNIETNLTDGIFSLFIDSDGELKYKVMDLMLNKEYIETNDNISVGTKIVIFGETEYRNNKVL